MRKNLFLYLFLTMAFMQAISAQSSSGEKMEADVATPERIEISAENKKRVTEILRETSAMTAMLRSPYNRIHFTLKSASTLWKLDEKEARALLTGAMNDIRQIIVETDAEMNRIENDSETDISAISGGNELWVKTNRITTLRSALINQLANLDPELGFNFLQETIKAITNQELKTSIENNDKYLEAMLIGRIAEKDTSKALDLGRKKLSEAVSPEVVNLLQTIYAKDKEKGAAFAEDVLKQIKLSGIDPNSSWTLSNLYSFSVANIEEITKEKSNDKPIFSEQSLRDLAVLLAKQIADPLNNNNYYGLTPEFVASLQKYAPQQTTQIKKVAELQKLRSEREKSRYEKTSNFNSSRQKMYEAQSKFQNEIGTKMQGLTDTNINSEQKKKIIEETKSKILESGNKSLRFTSLVSLAAQATNVGEKEIALDILEEAETLINLQPKEMREFTEVLTLAGGYASVKPEKSFPLVEDTIFRLNDVINAYVKFSEFQGGHSVIENDELRMGNSGGQVFGFFYYSSDLIGKLAEADFKRAKALADKFERPEFRVETRLMIAASLSQPQYNNMRRISPVISISRGFHFSGN